MSLNKVLVAFEQVISSGLLDRTNVRICHHSRPIYVSGVMSRYAQINMSLEELVPQGHFYRHLDQKLDLYFNSYSALLAAEIALVSWFQQLFGALASEIALTLWFQQLFGAHYSRT